MENYFKMNLPQSEIDAISNLGLAHMGDCVFEILCRGGVNRGKRKSGALPDTHDALSFDGGRKTGNGAYQYRYAPFLLSIYAPPFTFSVLAARDHIS